MFFILILLICSATSKHIEGTLNLRKDDSLTYKGYAPDSFIIIGVLSTPEERGHRERLRKHLVFPMTFLISTQQPSDELQDEIETNKDILLFRMEEKYIGNNSSPPYKVFGFFKLVEDFLPNVKYVVKMDNDIHVVDQKSSILDHQTELKTPFIAGRFNTLQHTSSPLERRKVLRSGRWPIREEAWPDDSLPPYPSGALYMISRDAIRTILDELMHNKNNFIMELPEDAMLSILSANISKQHRDIQIRQVNPDGSTQSCVFLIERCMHFVQSLFSFQKNMYTGEHLQNATLKKQLYSKSLNFCVQLVPQMDRVVNRGAVDIRFN